MRIVIFEMYNLNNTSTTTGSTGRGRSLESLEAVSVPRWQQVEDDRKADIFDGSRRGGNVRQ